MDSLFANGYISKIAFSTHFSQVLYESYIDFGLWRPSGMSDENDISWLPIESGYFYSIVPLGVEFQNPALDTKNYMIPGTAVNGLIRPPIAILSSGLSYNMVPSSIQA